MDPESRRIIEETVLAIVKKSNLEELTEFKVRETTAKQLGIDLSHIQHKAFIRTVIENFLISAPDPEVNVPEGLKETNKVQEEQGKRLNKNANENRHRVICKLSDRSNVVIDKQKEKTKVVIREFYEKDGKQHISRGINFRAEEWAAFKKNVPAIEDAIKQMESKLRSELDSKQPEEGKQTEYIPNLLNDVGPQALFTFDTIRFDGKNYTIWAQQMERFLNQLKIVYVLFESCPNSMLGRDASSKEIVQSKVAQQKWVNDDLVCRRAILNALSDDLFHLFSKKTMTAKELWEDIRIMYFYEQHGTKRSLVKKYIEFKMLDGKPVLEQVQEFNNIADSIVASGMEVEENFHVSVVISKLPPSWKDVSIELMREEHLPFQKLMGRLRFEEESRIRKSQRIPLNLVGNLPGNSVPRMQDMKPRNMQWNRQEPQKRGKVICQLCGKKGHTSKHCRYRKGNVDNEANEADDKKHEGNGSVPEIVEVGMSEKAVE